jgi:hypothetical protein
MILIFLNIIKILLQHRELMGMFTFTFIILSILSRDPKTVGKILMMTLLAYTIVLLLYK